MRVPDCCCKRGALQLLAEVGAVLREEVEDAEAAEDVELAARIRVDFEPWLMHVFSS